MIVLTQGHGRKRVILIAPDQGTQGTNPGSMEAHSVKTTGIVNITIWGDTKLYNRERAWVGICDGAEKQRVESKG